MTSCAPSTELCLPEEGMPFPIHTQPYGLVWPCLEWGGGRGTGTLFLCKIPPPKNPIPATALPSSVNEDSALLGAQAKIPGVIYDLSF